jgi:membrane associated rhomboid family serine protease
MQFGPSFTPDVIKWLIGGCIGLHLVAMYLVPSLYGMLLLSPVRIVESFAIWQIVTSPLFAVSGFALLFDMLALWMFGSELFVRWGRRRFATYLAVCAVGAMLVTTIVATLCSFAGVAQQSLYLTSAPTLSSPILALLLAYSLMFSEREVRLFFVLPVRTLYFVPVWLFVQLVVGWPLILWVADLAALAIGLAYCWQAGETRMTLKMLLHKFRRWRMRSKLRAIDNDELRRQQRRRNLH